MRNRVDPNKYAEYDALTVGDDLPETLQSNYVKPYTKKESVAKAYAKEGNLILITKATVEPGNILADLEGLVPIIKGLNQDILDESDMKYMKKDKEVLVKEPISGAKIIMKSGRLS